MLIIGVEPELWVWVVAAGDGDVCEAAGAHGDGWQGAAIDQVRVLCSLDSPADIGRSGRGDWLGQFGALLINFSIYLAVFARDISFSVLEG